MDVIIDNRSGFCFGVRKVISLAEKELKKEGEFYCLGDIVHNENEVLRLQNLGLKVIDRQAFMKLSNCKVLIRAHGEPPETYEHAQKNNIELIEGTCPVVLMLQNKIRSKHTELDPEASIVIFGKPDHPEVIGLNGQVNGRAKIVIDEDGLKDIDFTKPVVLFSQTTMGKEKYSEIKSEIEKRVASPELLDVNNSICGQVANRAPGLIEFSKSVDAIVFVGGKKSSNSKLLFEKCKETNPNSFFISSGKDIAGLPIASFNKVGVCGATSTPQWLMEDVAKTIESTFN